MAYSIVDLRFRGTVSRGHSVAGVPENVPQVMALILKNKAAINLGFRKVGFYHFPISSLYDDSLRFYHNSLGVMVPDSISFRRYEMI